MSDPARWPEDPTVDPGTTAGYGGGIETGPEPREGRSHEVGPRIARRALLGFVIGPSIGAVVGLAIALALGARPIVVATATLAGLLFGALGGFWGGLSGLRPPADEDDPLTAEQPTAADTQENRFTTRREP